MLSLLIVAINSFVTTQKGAPTKTVDAYQWVNNDKLMMIVDLNIGQ